MLSKNEMLEFLRCAAEINSIGADPDKMNIPYDPECPIKKGAKVTKIKMDNGGDMHLTGSTGITIGGVMIPEMGDAYLIKWDHSQHRHINGNVTFCTGEKLSDKL